MDMSLLIFQVKSLGITTGDGLEEVSVHKQAENREVSYIFDIHYLFKI